ECHGRGFDTQAIAGWNGPGPFKIVNNYLEGAGENVMFGGADPAIPNLVPSDIEIRRNHLFKPLSWKEDDPGYAGEHWAVKNLFELKNARRVLIEGNLFEHNWADAQNGFAILFTVRNQDGGAPWSVVEDVRFSRNILRHAAGGINILGRDYIHPSQQTKRIKIDNNLMYEIGGRQWGINGRFLQLNETVNVTVNHNTVLHTGNVITAYGAANEGFVFTNNLMPHNEYGVIGDSTPTGTWTLNRYFPSVQFKKNVIVGGEANRYPGKKNYYPATLDDVGFIDWRNGNYRLQGRSPYKGAGKKQKDIGANMDEIEAAIAGRIDPPGF
ncbi:MAG TPA: hypothetical protein VLD57_03205, partial [Blastocatellia bacterium]|nr:hypothetical protein [Blastocatellia bacterium]